MHDAAELEKLVEYLGEEKAAGLAEAARRGGYFGVPQFAFEQLARAVRDFDGRYGKAAHALDTLQDLMERFEERPEP